jgi:hypothetical protein
MKINLLDDAWFPFNIIDEIHTSPSIDISIVGIKTFYWQMRMYEICMTGYWDHSYCQRDYDIHPDSC